MKCISNGCEHASLTNSNYCVKHRPGQTTTKKTSKNAAKKAAKKVTTKRPGKA